MPRGLTDTVRWAERRRPRRAVDRLGRNGHPCGPSMGVPPGTPSSVLSLLLLSPPLKSGQIHPRGRESSCSEVMMSLYAPVAPPPGGVSDIASGAASDALEYQSKEEGAYPGRWALERRDHICGCGAVFFLAILRGLGLAYFCWKESSRATQPSASGTHRAKTSIRSGAPYQTRLVTSRESWRCYEKLICTTIQAGLLS